MENITETIYNFVSDCELLSSRKPGLNFLGAEEGDCAIENEAGSPKMRQYTDGTVVRRASFVFAVRGRLARSVKENLAAVALCEKLGSWLEEKAASGELPVPIFDLRVMEKGGFEATGTSEGRYTLRFEVLYI